MWLGPDSENVINIVDYSAMISANEEYWIKKKMNRYYSEHEIKFISLLLRMMRMVIDLKLTEIQEIIHQELLGRNINLTD